MTQSKLSGNLGAFVECNSSEECDVNMNCLRQSNELVAKCKCMFPYKAIYSSKTGLYECGIMFMFLLSCSYSLLTYSFCINTKPK
jgi:hypothetical protein